jgi:transketolase
VDGHSIGQLTAAFREPPAAGKPLCVIANTTKGKGVSFMEDVVKWHHGVPSDIEMTAAMKELDQAIASAERSSS